MKAAYAAAIVSCALAAAAISEPVEPVRVPASAPFVLMSTPRAAHAAVTLPDGQVALIGGCVVDGCEPGPGSSTVDIFDPRSNKLRAAGQLASVRIGTAAVALGGGRVLIAGGWSGRQTTASVEIFDPKAGRGVEVARLRTARADIAATTLSDGRIALIGGFDGRSAVGDVDIFDPRLQSIAAGPSLRVARAGAAAVTLADGRVLVAGGGESASSSLSPSAASEIGDAALARWSSTGGLALARYKHAAVALPDGRALIVGGSDARDRQGKIKTIEAFDPLNERYETVGETLRPRFKLGGAVVVLADGRIFIGGGAERGEVFDPRKRTSVLVGPSFGAVRSFSSASLLPDGRVVVAGGYEEKSIAVSRGIWIVRP